MEGGRSSLTRLFSYLIICTLKFEIWRDEVGSFLRKRGESPFVVHVDDGGWRLTAVRAAPATVSAAISTGSTGAPVSSSVAASVTTTTAAVWTRETGFDLDEDLLWLWRTSLRRRLGLEDKREQKKLSQCKPHEKEKNPRTLPTK